MAEWVTLYQASIREGGGEPVRKLCCMLYTMFYIVQYNVSFKSYEANPNLGT